MTDAWQPVQTELDRARDAGRTIEVWLRDDDAVAVTPALERLRDLCDACALPVLLAVIPAGMEQDLGRWIARTPSFTPCQHGFSHTNHAAPGQRACELGADRPNRHVLDDLIRGRQILTTCFGGRMSDVLVPPWNRIDPALPALLPDLGFSALSTFGLPPLEAEPIARLNADLDIVDWRRGRIGRSHEDVGGKMAGLVAASGRSGRPIGILTHHLVLDPQAWAVLSDLVERLAAHEAVAFAEPWR